MAQALVSCVLMLLWFAIMATTMTAAATITSSMKKPYYSSHIHGRVPAFFNRTSLQLDDHHHIVFTEFTSTMDTLRERRDVEALLSFRNAVIYDPHGSLLNWTPNNSLNVCSWNGIRCRKRTKRVVAIALPGLGLEGFQWWTK